MSNQCPAGHNGYACVVSYRTQSPESNPRYDLYIKVPLYAKYAVPLVWIVDVKNSRLHVFDQCQNGHYQSSELITVFDALVLKVSAQIEVDLHGLF